MMFHENCHRHICGTLHSSRSASYYQNLFVVSCTLCLRLSISVSIKISLMSLFEENLGSERSAVSHSFELRLHTLFSADLTLCFVSSEVCL